MRRRLIVGNWKMNLTNPEAVALVDTILKRVEMHHGVDVAVCPPFTALAAVAEEIKDKHVGLGAQNMFWKDSGAYTGQVSPTMLVGLGCKYVVLGHSETRGRFGQTEDDLAQHIPYFSETDTTINLKLIQAFVHALTPILCVGETLKEREIGQADVVVREQLERALSGIVADETYEMVVAYEPVWAIGTGQVCDADEASRICGNIRSVLERILSHEAAQSIRILYGGSVKGNNSAGILHKPNIDGALVGGASLDPEDFKLIISSA